MIEKPEFLKFLRIFETFTDQFARLNNLLEQNQKQTEKKLDLALREIQTLKNRTTTLSYNQYQNQMTKEGETNELRTENTGTVESDSRSDS